MVSKMRNKGHWTLIALVLSVVFAATASADMAAAKKWVDTEFQPSTLSKAQQLKEMEWFIKASKPFRGMEIKVVSETIPTHEYESKTLTKAFEEITGIKVTHDLIQEGDVIEKLQVQMQSGKYAPPGALVEFYRSPARVAWTPTGTNVPDYPKLAQLWWQNIGEAVAGEVTVDTAMDNLAREQDKILARIARSGVQGDKGPKLNKKQDATYWLNKPGSPKAKLKNEKPQGETVDYDKLIKAWREGRVK